MMNSDQHSDRYLSDPEFQSVLVSCLEKLERGESLDRDELLDAHPNHAEALVEFLADQAMLQRVASQVRDSLSGRNPDGNQQYPVDETIDSTPRPDGVSIGEQIKYVGEYEIIEEIARGGMGVVFKARQQKLNRTVALKMILAGTLADTADVERFYREARAAGRLKHPNIVPVHEIGEHEGRHYFTMDFVDGNSLAEQIREESLPPRRAAEVVRATAEAVQFAHTQGTVHRDLKPANVLLTADGSPQITDFGLAKMLESVDEESRAELTATGQILGTPSYMSPEQASGKQELVGPPSDIYSLGAILYACLTGRAPFVADSPVDTLLQVMNKEPVAPRDLNASIPKDVETICLKCLSKAPHQRYGTAGLLAEDLQNFLEGRPVLARPVSATTRIVRWAKRNPAIAALSTLSAVLLLCGTVVSSYFALEANRRATAETEERLRADQTAELYREASEETKRALVNEQRALVEAQTERDGALRQQERAEMLLYASTIAAAKQDIESGAKSKAGELLAACRWDLRGWEYDYLSEQLAQASPEGTHKQSFDGSEITALQELSGRIAANPDGTLLAIGVSSLDGKADGQIAILDAQGKASRRTLTGHQGRVTSLAFSPDGTHLISGAQDSTVRIWNVATGDETAPSIKQSSPVQSVAFSSDGQRFLCGGGHPSLPPGPNMDRFLQVYDFASGELIHDLAGHQAAVTTARFSPDGRWIASAGFGAQPLDSADVRVWDAESGNLLFTFDGPPIAAMELAFSPDSHRLAVAGGLGRGPQEVLLFDMTTGEQTRSLLGHRGTVGSVAFSHDGRRILTSGVTHQFGANTTDIRVWDAEAGVEVLQLNPGRKTAHSLWSADGKSVISALNHEDGSSIVEWHAPGNSNAPRILSDGNATSATSLAFGANPHRLVSCGVDKQIHVWDLKQGRRAGTLTTHTKMPLSVAVDQKNRFVVSGGIDGVRVWDAELHREFQLDDGHRQTTQSVAVSTDGKRCAFAGSRGIAVVRPLDAKGAEMLLSGHTSAIHQIVFSPDGRYVATASADQTARIWNASTGEETLRFEDHTSSVLCIAFVDNRHCVTGSHDRTIRLWNMQTGETQTVMHGHSKPAISVAVSNDGGRIVSGSMDKTVRVWDADSGMAIETLKGHSFMVRSVTISPDDRFIVSAVGLEDRTIRVWPMPIAKMSN